MVNRRTVVKGSLVAPVAGSAMFTLLSNPIAAQDLTVR